MRLIPLFASCILIVSACNQSANQKPAVALTEATLYDPNVVLDAVKSKSHSKEADKLFLKAIDEYRNAHHPLASVELFVKSAVLMPQAKTYYELGNALMDSKKLNEAIQAYSIAELLNYKPLSKLFYNKACAYSKAENRDSAMYYLMGAIEFGYSNMKNVLKDPDLKFVRDEYYNFQTDIMRAFAGVEEPEKLQWSLFNTQFQQVSFPFTIDSNYAHKLDRKQTISYDFEIYVSEMRKDKFTRDVGSEFYYVGLIKKDTAFKTLVYAVNDEVYDENSINPYYYLVSYDSYGKLIDKLLIAGHDKLKDPFRIATFNGNGDIELTEFEYKYEKNPEEEGFDRNKIISSTELQKKVYRLSENGHIVPKTEQLASR
ncbi:hypothetical protein DVR12_09925 [Chitinophaga silvatica]|uniref:Uncharacterized protein n=1 Tax=Chitinophaga silvatica TaxID=2282649 RepID=A0A3E1YBA9_9BACT|nr:hypothetical protein [Chitinophaga silvatica]RFS23326.1 hypothetical protein DVR12_09925 [Chitinophaga silvatica]